MPSLILREIGHFRAAGRPCAARCSCSSLMCTAWRLISFSGVCSTTFSQSGLLGLKTPSSAFSWFLSLNHWRLPPSVLSRRRSVSSLPASGRRIADICFLSRSARTLPSDLGLSLSWVTAYSHKFHAPLFPATPIRHMTSGVPRVRLLCPVRAYVFLISRSLIWIEDVPLSLRRLRLWGRPRTLLPTSMGSVSGCFYCLVVASRRHRGGFGSVSVGPHQMCMLAASYSLLGQDE